MGTAFTITIFSAGQTREKNSTLLDKAFEIIKDIEGKMYSQNEESLVWRFNHSADGRPVTLDDDTFFVVGESLRLAGISDGAFDITDVPLKTLWANAKEKSEPPSAEAIQEALALTGYQRLNLDTTAKTLTRQKTGVKINVDAPAQGYAADKALLHLKNQGVASAMIKVGENTRWIGLAPESRHWRFGIDHPRNIDEYAAILELQVEKATSSTGDYEDFFIYKGKRTPLMINPKTGEPPMNGVVGVTVTAENIAFANLLSRLFFILGPEKSYEFIDRHKEEGIEALFIEENKNGRLLLTSSEGLRNSLKDIHL